MNTNDLAAIGAALLNEGELVGAEGAAEAAVLLDPNAHDAWVVLGAALAKQNKHEQAVGCFERAIALDPKDVASHTSLGELLIELGAYRRAADTLKIAKELDPTAAHPSGRRARALVGKTLSTLKAM